MFSKASVSGLSVDYALQTADTKTLNQAIYLYDREFIELNLEIRQSLKGGYVSLHHITYINCCHKNPYLTINHFFVDQL